MILLIGNGLHNDSSSVIFVGEMSPNVSSNSVIYVGTTQAKPEPNNDEGTDAVKEEANNNADDAELSQILNSFISMNLNTTLNQSKHNEYNGNIESKYFSCNKIN